MNQPKRVKWTNVLENYFKELGEQSLCLSMLHKSAEATFSRKSQYIDLPVIILSTLCGSLTLSAKSLFGEANEENALKAVGALSLFSGVLATIQAYFSFARRAENHRNSYLEYAKLYRFTKTELGLPRQQRISAKDLIKLINDMYERLNELSPLIPEKILSAFKSKYKKDTLIKRPPIINGLEPIQIFIPSQGDDSSDSDASEEFKKSIHRRKKRFLEKKRKTIATTEAAEEEIVSKVMSRMGSVGELFQKPTLLQSPDDLPLSQLSGAAMTTAMTGARNSVFQRGAREALAAQKVARNSVVASGDIVQTLAQQTIDSAVSEAVDRVVDQIASGDDDTNNDTGE